MPWNGKIVDIDSLVARTATLGMRDEYAAAYATYPAWPGACLVMGIAVPARDELERAKAVRDRFAAEILPHVRVIAGEEPKEMLLKRAPAKELAGLALAACAFATASPLAKSIQGLSFAGIGAGRCAVAVVALVAIAPVATWRAARALEAHEGRTRRGGPAPRRALRALSRRAARDVPPRRRRARVARAHRGAWSRRGSRSA